MTIRKVLLIVAVILFLAVAVGFDSVTFGSSRFGLLGFGLAAFAASFLL